MIPMVDLRTQHQSLKQEIQTGLDAALETCRFIMGPNVTTFEEEAAAYLNTKYAISCASGTDALHLALRAANIKAGDEVITTAFTFIATAEAIKYLGAKPVFVDIDPATFNIDPQAALNAISAKTTAILPVHLFGQPANMHALQTIATEHNLSLIEDCAQAFGASIDSQKVGTFGHSGCFSFFPSKNLGCYGDGGMITTNSRATAEALKLYRNHGSRKQYDHSIIGYNSRLDELQAVILGVKLKYIDRFNEQRRNIAHRYNELLADTDLTTPHEDNIGQHVYHQYTVLLPEGNKRQAMMESLKAKGVASAIYYPIPLHQQAVFKNQYLHLKLPVTETIAERCLSLPMFPEMNDSQIDKVCFELKEAIRQ